MKVELSIGDDRELKAMIKDMIKGEIVSIARGEIKNILRDVLKEGVIPKSQSEIDSLIKEEIRKLVREIFNESSWRDHTFIKTVTREIVQAEIKQLLREGNALV